MNLSGSGLMRPERPGKPRWIVVPSAVTSHEGSAAARMRSISRARLARRRSPKVMSSYPGILLSGTLKCLSTSEMASICESIWARMASLGACL